jgi:pectin methylesterase-like acyl-CoA thioesterase
VAAACLLGGAAAAAQTPVLLPGTITNVVGSLPAASATTAGSACATNSPYTATDTLGDGCPATSAVLQGTEDSIAVDPLGNIFLGVLNNAAVPMIRRIDARTGLITNIAGTAAGQCAGSGGNKIYGTTAVQTDKYGDGCPITYAYNMQKPTFLAVDPYGNLLISTTADYSLHMVCYAQSPLCSATRAAENIMIPVVGCATSSTAAGIAVLGATPGSAGDGTVAVTTGASSCTGLAGVGKYLYGVIADKWDNVYFADSTNGRYRVVAGAPSITVNGTTYTNPLYATLATSTGSGINYSTSGTNPLGVHQGYVYPIAGGGTVCTASGADAYGDGCPFYQTTVVTTSNGSYLQGVAVDNDGDFIFLDGNGYLRVIYEGGTVIKGAITANNSAVTTPVLGTSYALIGGGTKLYYNSALALQKGNAMQLQGTIPQTLTTDPAGNVLIGDQEQILFYDIATGYVRRLATANGATICAAKTDSVGDGCPLTGATFGAGSALLSLAEDGAGNLYMLDPTNHLVRKVITTLQPTTAVNGSVTTSLAVHSPAGGSVAVTAATGSDISVGSVTCAAANADGSVDCSGTVTYAPKKLGQRNDSVSVATTISGATTTQNVALSGLSTGTALVFDPSASPLTSTIASLTTGITAIAMDGTGNAYVSGTQGITRINAAGSTTTISSTAATYIAVDTQGSVYTSSSSLASPSSSITKYTYSASAGTFSSSTITIPTLSICTGSSTALTCGAATQIYGGPLAVDALGGIYFVDVKNLHAFKLSQSSALLQQLTQTAFTAPTAMTQDSYGNLLVLDGTKVLEVPPSGFAVTTSSPYANTPIKLTTALIAPTGIAVDQAENVYIADTVGGVNTIKVQSASNYAQSAANYQYTMPGVTGTALAVDGAGNLYVTASGTAGVTVVTRNAETYNFGTSLTASDTGVFLNTGATNSTGFVQTDTTTDFTETAPSSPMAAGGPTCNLVSTVLLGGGLCNVTFTFTPTANGSGDTPDVISLLPAANTLGQLSLDATKTGANATTATAITGNTTGLVYSTGTETTFTVTVSESPAAVPTGTVAVTIDTNAPVNYTLTQLSSSSATATVPVSGLSAGFTHSISATYGSSSGITGSSSGATSFTISSATTSVSWTPGTTSIQYSAPVGTAALNATSSSPAKSGSVAGVFVYTATPAGGSAQNIHSASYLPIGTYALGVTFVPTDAVDYQSSTGSVGTFNVTMANTTAGLGATQTVVASDGTGMYTSVQAAVNALPTGGSIYIKPGTYTGDITVVQPNISFRGLGGDPTKVVLTHSGGAFSNSGGVYQYAGEFTTAQNNSSQLPAGGSTFSGDEGSATLVVAKGTNTAISSSQQSPTGFYAENLSLVNSYNTDNTTMTTTYVSGGNCVAGNGTSYSYQTLYNMQIECASQALALWITSDLSVMNNVFATSRQDTVYTASPGQSSGTYVPTRQYWFRGKVSGDVDYIFGDAAAVFDSTSIYTDWHGITASSGTETVHAQNMAQQTPGYLSGYIMNNAVLTSQSSGMTALYLGRPYGTYSTWVMLNSYIDQTNANGYTNSLGVPLVNTTFLEYNDIPYTDPATGSADLNGIPYLGTGGSTGQGVTGTRESQFLSPNTQSTNPGTPEFGNMPPTTMTQAQAQAYFPTNFLSQTVPTSVSSTANWNPTTALATNVNAFTSAATVTNAAGGSNVTIVMRPQTPGLGAIVPTSYSAASPTPVTFTVPTGTYTLKDTIGGNTTTLASGTLDASGEAYYSTSTLAAGAHSLTWTYSGDSNFSGSTSGAYALTISAASTTTTLSGAGVTYGTAASVTATVAASSATPTGNVTLTIDGTSMMTQALSGGTTTFSVTGLLAGSHSFSASYAGAGALSASSTASNLALTVSPATVTVTGSCANRGFDHASSCSAVVGPLQYSDTVSTVFAGTPTGSTPALPNSPAGSYAAVPLATLSSFGSANYTLNAVNGSFTVSGGALQSIIFPTLPNFAHGSSYQLTAYTTSGLPVTYTITGGSSYASISGTTLTVTGAGVVTIQASTAADPTGDYAQATAVSRSFTAQ